MKENGILVYVWRRSPLALPETVTSLGWKERKTDRQDIQGYPGMFHVTITDTFRDTINDCDVLEKNVIKFIPD